MTTENWPDIGRPAYAMSPFTVIYFVAFMLIMIVVVLSVPVSVIFESFKHHRRKQVIEQRVRERHALLSAYHLLDIHATGQLEYGHFEKLVERIMTNTREQASIRRFFELMDKDKNDQINVFEFFNLCEVILWTVRSDEVPLHERWLWLRRIGFIPSWNKFRETIVRWFYIDVIVHSAIFQLIIFLAVVGNTAILASYTDNMPDSTIAIYDKIDIGFLIFFCVELVLKFLALGAVKYLRDRWNRFDAFLVVLTLFTTLALPSITNSDSDSAGKSARAIRVTNIGKLWRIVRLVRALRVLRVLRLVSSLAAAFKRLNDIISKLIAVLPNVVDPLLMLVLSFYLWGILGCEMYSIDFITARDSSPQPIWYDDMVNFSTFPEALLSLFQVFTGSNWQQIMFNVWSASSNHSGYWQQGVAFVFSFFIVVSMLLTNLIIALVWEIFMVIKKENLVADEDEDESEADTAIAHQARMKIIAEQNNNNTSGQNHHGSKSVSAEPSTNIDTTAAIHALANTTVTLDATRLQHQQQQGGAGTTIEMTAFTTQNTAQADTTGGTLKKKVGFHIE